MSDLVHGAGGEARRRRAAAAVAATWRWAADNEPAHERADPRVLRAMRQAESVGAVVLLRLNGAVLERYGRSQARWSTARWPWIAALEAATPQFRQEIERYVAGQRVPHVAELTGLEPESEQARQSLPLDTGTWRTLMLYANGRWIPELVAHFPVTRDAFASIGPKANVGFSVVEGHTHIGAHRDPNKGALRLHLPLIVPGDPGDCRIRIDGDVVHWVAGEALVFDLNAEHEVWNDTDDPRVVLSLEFDAPLPRPLAILNRAAQHAYRWHPSFRGMPGRVGALARTSATA